VGRLMISKYLEGAVAARPARAKRQHRGERRSKALGWQSFSSNTEPAGVLRGGYWTVGRARSPVVRPAFESQESSDCHCCAPADAAS